MTPQTTSARGGALLWVVCVGMAVAVATGCSRSDTVDGVARIAGDNTFPMPPVTTQLLDAGAAPRVRLDAAASIGAPQQISLTVQKDMRQEVDGQPDAHFVTPDVTIPLTATAAIGEIGLVVGSASSSDATLAAALTPATGSRAALVTDDRGSVTAFQLDPAERTDPEARAALQRCLAQAIEQQIVFPDAAIGQGAVWTIRRQVPGRVPLEQTTTATLLSRANGVLRIQVRVEQRVATDLIVAADRTGLEVAADADEPLRGTGTFVIDPRLPLPLRADVSIDGDRVYRDAADTVQLRQITATRVRWGS